MDTGQRRRQAGIALIFYHDDRPGLGDGEVHAGDPDARRQELLAQRVPGYARQAFGVVVHGNAEFVCEELRNRFFGFVNSRCDEMRRTVARQLQQVLAEVGLYDLAPGSLEDLVQVDLLGGHRLALDDGAIVPAARQVGDQAAGVRAVSDPVHLPAGCDDLTFQLLQVVIEMGQGMQLHPMRVLPQRLPVIHLIDDPPLQLAEAYHGAAHGGMQRRIAKRGFAVLDEINTGTHHRSRRIHCAARISARCTARTGLLRLESPPAMCIKQLLSVAVTTSTPADSMAPIFASSIDPDSAANLTENIPPKPQHSSTPGSGRSSSARTAASRRSGCVVTCSPRSPWQEA